MLPYRIVCLMDMNIYLHAKEKIKIVLHPVCRRSVTSDHLNYVSMNVTGGYEKEGI